MEVLGQKVNPNKLEIYFINAKIEVETKICNTLGFRADWDRPEARRVVHSSESSHTYSNIHTQNYTCL